MTRGTALRAGGVPRPARRRLEHGLQEVVAQFLEVALAGVAWWSSVDHGAGAMSKAAAGRRKARGVKPGLPDIIVLYRGRLIGIELKAGRGRASDAQDDLHAAWAAQGASVRMCRSLAEVDGALAGLGVPLRFRVLACGTRWAFSGWGGGDGTGA